MPTDRAQDIEAIRAARIHLARPEDRALLRTRAEHDLTAACIPRQSCLEPEVNEVGAVVLALLDENGRLVARLEAAERALAFYANQPNAHGTYSDVLEDGGDRARAALAAAAPGETEQTP